MKKQSKSVEELEKIIIELEVENQDLKNKYLRALADYQNLEKRIQSEYEKVRQFAGELILRKIIPATDSILRAKEHLHDEGLNIAWKEIFSVLTEIGVEKIEVVGKQFDPIKMECIDLVPGNENEVIKEVSPGYLYKDKIIRVAKVVVGKNETAQKKAADDSPSKVK
jgi:molecular chaperone GrpE